MGEAKRTNRFMAARLGETEEERRARVGPVERHRAARNEATSDAFAPAVAAQLADAGVDVGKIRANVLRQLARDPRSVAATGKTVVRPENAAAYQRTLERREARLARAQAHLRKAAELRDAQRIVTVAADLREVAKQAGADLGAGVLEPNEAKP